MAFQAQQRPTFGQAMQMASPLLLALGAGAQQGQPYAYLNQGLAAMMAQRDQRMEEQARARAQTATEGFLSSMMGGPVGPQMGTPNMEPIAQPSANPAGLPGSVVDAVDRANVPSALPTSLIRTESAGNFSARNDVTGAGGHVGHFGRGQFGVARLNDAKAAGAIPHDMTPDQFMANPQAQQAVEQWHVADINNFIRDRGLDRYVGQQVNGVTITPNGMLAVAHLGGKGGLQRFLETGGQYNPADAFGTSLMDYMRTHGEVPGTAPQQQPDRFANLDPQRAAFILQSPHVSPQIKEMVMAQFMPQGGDPTSAMREYELARAQGFQGSFIDYQTALAEARRNQTNVTVEGQPQVGTIPQGYELFQTEDGAYQMRAIPGGPADQEAQARASEAESVNEAAQLAMADYDRKFGIVDDGITRALEMLERHGGLVAGIGSTTANIPGSPARNFQAVLETVKANLGFEELQAMRDNSPTGGALGQVTEREIAFLQAIQGNLDAAQSPSQLAQVLRDIQSRRREFAEERRRILAGATEGAGQSSQDQTEIDRLLEKYAQ